MMMEWISVKNGKPRPGERVLVSNGITVFEMYLTDRGKWLRTGNYELPNFDVMWWAPLPAGPKKEDTSGDEYINIRII